MNIDFGIFRVRIVRPSSLTVSLGPTLTKTFEISEGTGPMDLQLGDNQYTTIHLHGLDAAKLEGSFKAPPGWSVDDPSVVQITPSADGRTCKVESATPPKLGFSVLTVTDQDDPGVTPLVFNITVTAEQPTTLGATVDPPTEKPTPAEPPAEPPPPPVEPAPIPVEGEPVPVV